MKIRVFKNFTKAAFVVAFLLSISVQAQWSGTYANDWIVDGQQYVKVTVTKEGIQSIPIASLPTDFKTLVQSDISKLQLWHRGAQVALIKPESVGGGDVSQVLFYGILNDGKSDEWLYRPGPSARTNTLVSLFSDNSSYFLTVGNSTVPRAEKIVSANVTPIPASAEVSHSYTDYHVLRFTSSHEPSDAGLRPPYMNSFYEPGRSLTGELILVGSLVTSNYSVTPVGKFEFKVLNLSSGKPKMKVWLTGRSVASRSVNIVIVDASGNAIRTIPPISSGTETVSTITGFSNKIVEFDLETTDYDAVTGKGYLGFTGFSSDPLDMFSVSYFNVTYTQAYNAGSDTYHKFLMDAAGPAATSSKVQITGLPADNIKFYDITDHYAVKVIDGVVNAGVSEFNLPRTPLATLNLLATSEVNTPAFATVTLGTISKNPDYLIISTDLLFNEAVKYGTFRSSTYNSSKKTSFVPYTIKISDVYNHFNYGEPSPVAIKRFVDFMLSGSDKDKFLLLVGKSVSRDYWADIVRELPDNVPTFGYPGSDELLVDGLAGASEDVPAIPVGRIPALTEDHLKFYLAKVKEYEFGLNESNFSWRNKVVHVSGGTGDDQASNFKGHLAQLATDYITTPPGQVSQYFKTSNSSGIEDFAITELQTPSAGVGLITFFGHGTTWRTDKNISYVVDPSKSYYDSKKYAGMLFFGCDVNNIFKNRFVFPMPIKATSVPLGMDWLFAENKGAIVVFGNSWDGYEQAFKPYMDMLYPKLFVPDSQKKPIGTLIKEVAATIVADPAKQSKYGGYLSSAYLQYQANIHQGILLGDPAIRLLYTRSTALPVELHSFNGQREQNQIKLTWATAWEKDNGHFEIQRSNDAKTFETIGVVDGKGTVNEESTYAYFDINPLKGNNYYRLMQQDDLSISSDVKPTFSRIILVKGQEVGEEVVIAPNPVLFQFEIKSNGGQLGVRGYRVFNSTGQVILPKGRDNIVDMSSFPAGIYTVEVITSNGVITKKIVKY